MRKIIIISLFFGCGKCYSQNVLHLYPIDTIVSKTIEFADVGYFHDELIRDKDGKLVPKHTHLNPQMLATYYPQRDSLVIYSDTIKFIKAILNGKYQSSKTIQNRTHTPVKE